MVTACRRTYPMHTTTTAYADIYKAVLQESFAADTDRQIQRLTLENLVTETYENLEKEKA